MITVTLGTIPFKFDRAINWLRLLLEQGVFTDSLFIQHGITDVSAIADHPLVTTTPILNPKRFSELLDSSRLVISHGGQGSTRTLASRGASFLLLPRLARYREHIDDHQLLFVQSVEHLGVQYCLSLESLRQSILEPPPPLQKRLFDGPKLADHLLAMYPAGAFSGDRSIAQLDQLASKAN